MPARFASIAKSVHAAAAFAAGARRDQEKVGGVRVVDEQFVAFEQEAGAAFARAKRDAAFRPASVGLQMSGRGDQFAARDRRKQAALLLVGAGAAAIASANISVQMNGDGSSTRPISSATTTKST